MLAWSLVWETELVFWTNSCLLVASYHVHMKEAYMKRKFLTQLLGIPLMWKSLLRQHRNQEINSHERQRWFHVRITRTCVSPLRIFTYKDCGISRVWHFVATIIIHATRTIWTANENYEINFMEFFQYNDWTNRKYRRIHEDHPWNNESWRKSGGWK